MHYCNNSAGCGTSEAGTFSDAYYKVMTIKS
jgi:hypothetical protein